MFRRGSLSRRLGDSLLSALLIVFLYHVSPLPGQFLAALVPAVCVFVAAVVLSLKISERPGWNRNVENVLRAHPQSASAERNIRRTARLFFAATAVAKVCFAALTGLTWAIVFVVLLRRDSVQAEVLAAIETAAIIVVLVGVVRIFLLATRPLLALAFGSLKLLNRHP